MPLGGLIPYDDEEERRRRLMLTPPINPNAARLPEAEPGNPSLPVRRPEMLPPPSPPSSIAPLGRREEYDMAKDFYMRDTPGRGKSALTGALEGFMGGGGLLGAITGAAGGAIDPRGLRERQFNQKVRPGLMERFSMEDQEAARVRQAEEDALNREFRTAQIGELNRRNLPEPPKLPAPVIVAPGNTAIDPTTGKPIYTAPAAPKEQAPLRMREGDTLLDPKTMKPIYSAPKTRAPGSGRGGGGGSSQKEMRSAKADMAQFERLRTEAIRANADGDEELFSAKRGEMDALADRIDALYGDSVEVGVGEGGWPYVKFRRQGARQGDKKQATPTRRQGQSADPIGVR